MHNSAAPGALRTRKAPALIALAIAALVALTVPSTSLAGPKPSVLTFKTAKVGAPGNPSVGIVPFTDAVYRNCEEAPVVPKKPCQQVGAVKYNFGVAQLEVTVAQYVAFLNTVDPKGKNRHKLYSRDESGSAWPRFGQINRSAGAANGRHYEVAAPEWANKPYGFANFLRSARFANSLHNGKLISKRSSTEGSFRYVTYKVRLSRVTEKGMYDMAERAMTRAKKSGFVIPSQDEWIKSAYFDRNGGGSFSYWKYPTNAGVFGDNTATAPVQATLDPTNGNVTNAAAQPLAIYHNTELSPPAPPSWCPSSFSSEACTTVNPFGLDPTAYAKAFAGSVGSVGQAGTLGPWGTLDQGGNVVEWTDTITPAPFGIEGKRVWRRLHGGIANAPVYQLWLSAVGLNPQDNAFFTATYPWLGIRVGVIGNPKPDKG